MLRPRASQRQWRLARILLTTTGVAAVIVFVLVVVPALGSAYDGFRNVVIIVFANLQIVAIIGQVPGVPAFDFAWRLVHCAYISVTELSAKGLRVQSVVLRPLRVHAGAARGVADACRRSDKRAGCANAVFPPGTDQILATLLPRSPSTASRIGR